MKTFAILIYFPFFGSPTLDLSDLFFLKKRKNKDPRKDKTSRARRKLKYLLSIEYFLNSQSTPWRIVNPKAKKAPENWRNLFDPNKSDYGLIVN